MQRAVYSYRNFGKRRIWQGVQSAVQEESSYLRNERNVEISVNLSGCSILTKNSVSSVMNERRLLS